MLEQESAQKENCCADCSQNPGAYQSIFFDEQLFLAGENLSTAKTASQEKIKGGIIPHHLLAGQFISDFFKKISPAMQTVILLGPNHQENGESDAISAQSDWATPFGIVKTDKCLINDLNNKNIFAINENVMGAEHSMGSIMPYVKKYLPQAKVVPIILKQNIENTKLDSIAQELSGLVKKENVLLIASIDFSHYLISLEAEKKDEETLKAIKEKDYMAISDFQNDHLDSKTALIILLKTFEKYGNISPQIINHSNAAEILNQKNINETTSYFEIIFIEK